VLHVGQTPFVAGLPFFMVTAFAFCISLLVLHLLEGGAISRMLLKFFNFWVIEDAISL